MIRVSHIQVLCMIILFQLGSSSLFQLASEAKRDAWIAVAVGFLIGLALLAFIYLPIHFQAPDLSLIEMFRHYFGKYIGFVVGLTYLGYFIYKSVRNVREFGDLVTMYLLPGTPLGVVMTILLIVGAYAIFHGLEVFFRVGQVMLPWMILIHILLYLLMFISGLVHFERLLPMFERGWKPIWQAAFPETISFPFGEMLLFLMFWKYVSKKKLRSYSLYGYIFAGIFIIVTNIIILATLGNLASAEVIPLMSGMSLIQIGGILERLDPFVSLLLFNGVFFKQVAYYFGAVFAFSELFRVKNRYAILPVGVIIFTGAAMFNSHMQQVRFGFLLNLKYHFPIFQMVIPVLLLVVMLIRGPLKNKSRPSKTDEQHLE